MLVSITHLSDLTGFDRRTVASRLKDLPFEGGDGRNGKQYQSKKALRTLYGGINGDLDPQQEKAQLDKVRREGVELDNAKKRGDMVSAEDVKEEWLAMIGAIRAGMLAVPSRAVVDLSGVTDERKQEEIITAAINEAMGAVADDA